MFRIQEEVSLGYSAPKVDRIWVIWGSYYKIPKARFYLLKGIIEGVSNLELIFASRILLGLPCFFRAQGLKIGVQRLGLYGAVTHGSLLEARLP